MTQWGDKILFSHGSTQSGGVALCFNNFPGQILTHRTDAEGHRLTADLRDLRCDPSGVHLFRWGAASCGVCWMQRKSPIASAKTFLPLERFDQDQISRSQVVLWSRSRVYWQTTGQLCFFCL
ncbi:hypothetical protein XENOCAPTIV_013909 [Xenoophorus captivus]|uniref:MHC class I antigen n=1 Tax=Xenoophorus captivus TaxID=1517983 RepID=A0ABV0S6X6_9TELE